MARLKRMIVAAVTFAFGCAQLVGCAGPRGLGQDDSRLIDASRRAELCRTQPILSGNDGERMTWEQLIETMEGAEAIILGEEHDDAVGHAIQLAIVEAVLNRWPDSVISMEMFDRSEQAIVDDYLADIVDRETFLEQTASTRWRAISRDYLDGKINRKTFREKIGKIAWPSWETNYQPIVDAAKSRSARIIAANTPWLRYASMANKKGFDHLGTLTPSQRELFETPHQLPSGRYRERFWEVMVHRPEGEEPPIKEESGNESNDVHPTLSDEDVLGMFRAQSVMDATMADSIADALAEGRVKVVHLVGQFHSDFDGGLVQELRRRRDGVRVMTISMIDAAAANLRKEDAGRADVVIYTRCGSD